MGGAQGQEPGVGEKVFYQGSCTSMVLSPGYSSRGSDAFSQRLIKFRGQGEVPQGGLPGVVGDQERRGVCPQVAAEDADHLGLGGLAVRQKTRAAALPEKCQPACGTMPPYTVVPGGNGFTPMTKCSISARQALALAGYQPTGSVRSRICMVASLGGGRSDQGYGAPCEAERTAYR